VQKDKGMVTRGENELKPLGYRFVW